MITEINKNLWDFDPEQYYRVITTNGCINRNDEAIMGKGIALQAKERYPYLPIKLGNKLKEFGNHVNIFHDYKIITFPTKDNWRNKSTYSLIQYSCNELIFLCGLLEIKKIVMPMVGCSNGGLEWENVKNIIYQKLGNRDIEIIIARI